MTDERQIQAELEDAQAAAAEHQRLTSRLEASRRRLAQAEHQVEAAALKLADESADVAALESFSPTRIWAGVRGRRESDLDRERAEQQAAEYAAASAENARQTAAEEVRHLEEARAELGQVAVRRERALAAKEAWLSTSGSERAGQLVEIAGELGVVRSTLVEVEEARVAAVHAHNRLADAVHLLGKADDWAAWDTWGGGGTFTDMMKYDRMDEAAELLRQADQSLKKLTRELGDIDMSSVRGVEVDGLTRTFDVWFDNIFSDWAVRDRIREADERTRSAVTEVRAVMDRLAEREQSLRARAAELAATREDLLGVPPA